ncbi:MAG: FMN-binding protein [Firmicutes bacterium]|nr:FMN-binding protein [Bacillota bacterium]
MRKRKLLTALFVVMAALLAFPAAAHAAEDSVPVWLDGTWEGSGTGYQGKIVVSVSVEDGAIRGIDIISHQEDEPYWSMLMEEDFLQAIIDASGGEVDSVSGATKSSEGVKQAVADALAKAEKPDSPAFARGKGTAKYPYVIETADQLAAFAQQVDAGNEFAGEYIQLGADIDLTEAAGWNPIGQETTINTTADKSNVDQVSAFNGDFDGADHVIRGLTIQGSLDEEKNLGLFSTLKSGARVRDLHLEDVNIDVTAHTVTRAGGLCGDTMNGTVSDGTSGAMIDGCSVTGRIRVDVDTASMAFAGGITGRANICAVVSNTWSDADVEAYSRGGNPSAYAGGIVGTTGNAAVLVNDAVFGRSYACAPKSTNFGGMAGGLGAMLACRVWNTYAMGDAGIGHGGSSHSWVGALGGDFTTSGMTKSGSEYVYPPTGDIREFGYYADDIGLTEETWGEDAAISSLAIAARASGVGSVTCDTVFETKAQALSRESMGGQEFADTLNSNLKTVKKRLDIYGYTQVSLRCWEVSEGVVLPQGEPWYATEVDEDLFAGGSGTAEDPWQIETESQLRAFAGSLTEGIDYDGSYVKVTRDIDISGSDWSPIGGQEYAFNGTFDGGGFTIRGMHAGTEEAPYVMGSANPYMGFFAVLGRDAKVKDLHLTDVSIYASSPRHLYLGGIAGINDASDTRAATVIDGCSVQGSLRAEAEEGNTFLGGIYGYQNHGAVINTWTDTDLVCTVKKGNAIAEAGGISALNNRGLIAACYTLGNVQGSASRSDGDEGMAATGNLVGVNAGDLAGCCSFGDNTTAEYSVYAGELAGWITGIGKVYSCWYNREAKMTIDGRAVVPPADFGTKVPPGVNEEGDAYVGGVVDDLKGFTGSELPQVAEAMNGKYASFPIEITQYGLSENALRLWGVRDEGLFLTGETAALQYVQPEAELVTAAEPVLRDGIWYGRSEDKSAVVAIIVTSGSEEEHAITDIRALSGETSGDAYEEALETAKEKCMFGDPSGYGKADLSAFAGKGTKENPYRIETEQQLRMLARSVNADESFEGVWFRQSADIDLSGQDWLPIGYVVYAKRLEKWGQYAAYPFRGNYDGGDFRITGLHIGTKEAPEEAPAMAATAGLFGFVTGSHDTNSALAQDEQPVRLENIRLEGVQVHVSTEDQNYAAGLVGVIQNGFVIDRCSVTGEISSNSKNSFARAGAISSNVLRGMVMNTWADASVSGITDAGNAYVGGLYAMDNRTASLNCYSLCSVTADAAANNKIHVGGITGQSGGVHYNCYAAGDVTALKTTSDAGVVNGRAAGICVERAVYYSTDAKVTVAGAQLTPPPANGVTVPADEESVQVIGRSASGMASAELAKELERGRMAVTQQLASISEKLQKLELTHVIQSEVSPEALSPWQQKNGRITLMSRAELLAQEKAQAAKAAAAKQVKAIQSAQVKKVKVKAKKGGKAKIRWKALGKGYTYEVYRSAKLKKGYRKVKTTTGKKTVLKKLKKGRAYYVKVRAYQKINGKKVYTQFSRPIKMKAR